MLEVDIETCFSAGWSDGLPVVPPYRGLVDRMRDAMRWDADEVVAQIDAQRLHICADHLAAAAVMAGCLPEYAPVLRPLSEAMFEPAFNLSGVEVTTGGVSVTVIVSGQVVERLGFAHGANAVGGANTRINATIGRYANLVRHLCGRGGGVLEAHGNIGHPGRLSFLVAERLDRLWEPFHTQNGLPAEASAVSIFSSEGPNSVNNHYARTADGVLETIADCLGHAGTTNYNYRTGVYVVVIGPNHGETISQSYSRQDLREYFFENSRRPTDDLIRMGRVVPTDDPMVAQYPVEPGTMRAPVTAADRIFILESGAFGGAFSAVIPGWVGAVQMITREVKE